MPLATKISSSPEGKHDPLESHGTEPVRRQNVRPEK